MNFLKMVIIILMFVPVVWGESNDLKFRVTSEEYKQYIETIPELKKADEKLNTIYKKLMSALKDPSEKKFLQKEQLEWLKTREDAALAAGPKGSEEFINTLINFTIQRSTILEERLQNLNQNLVSEEVKPEQEKLSENLESSFSKNNKDVSESASEYKSEEQQEKNSQGTESTLTSEVNKETSSGKDIINVIAKYFVFFLTINAIVAIILHNRNEKLTIYRDFTDLTISGIATGIFLILTVVDVSKFFQDILNIIALLAFLFISFSVFRISYITNGNSNFQFK